MNRTLQVENKWVSRQIQAACTYLEITLISLSHNPHPWNDANNIITYSITEYTRYYRQSWFLFEQFHLRLLSDIFIPLYKRQKQCCKMSSPGPGCRQVPKPLSPPPTTRHKGIIKDHQVFRQQDWNLSEGSLLGRLPWCSINNILSVPIECQSVECWLSRLPCFFHLVSSCLKLDHVGTFSSPLLELQSVETDCTRGHMIHMWLGFSFLGSRF